MNNLISNLPFTILAAVILKQKLKEQYYKPGNPYTLSFQFILERFLYFLEENNDIGYVCAESRDSKPNSDLLEVFSRILSHGSYFNDTDFEVAASRFQSKIQKMIFFTKQKNENGHQIADLIAYPTAKFGLCPEKKNLAFEIIKPKFRSRNGKIEGCGLKFFPNKKMGPGHSQSPSN